MMPTPQVTPADLARLRARLAAVSAAVAPKLAEVSEMLPRVLAEQVTKIGPAMEAIGKRPLVDSLPPHLAEKARGVDGVVRTLMTEWPL